MHLYELFPTVTKRLHSLKRKETIFFHDNILFFTAYHSCHMVRGGVDCGQSIEALTQGVRQLLTLKVTPLGNFDSPIDRTTRTLFLLLLDCRRKP